MRVRVCTLMHAGHQAGFVWRVAEGMDAPQIREDRSGRLAKRSVWLQTLE